MRVLSQSASWYALLIAERMNGVEPEAQSIGDVGSEVYLSFDTEGPSFLSRKRVITARVSLPELSRIFHNFTCD